MSSSFRGALPPILELISSSSPQGARLCSSFQLNIKHDAIQQFMSFNDCIIDVSMGISLISLPTLLYGI